jgi:hypothetical protein
VLGREADEQLAGAAPLRASCSGAGDGPVFLSLCAAGSRGRKSATAAAISTASQPSKACSHASASCAAVVTGTTCAPLGAVRATFAATSVTSAPRASARAASA